MVWSIVALASDLISLPHLRRRHVINRLVILRPEMAEYLYKRTQGRVSGGDTPSSPPGMESVIFCIPGSGITSK